MKGIAVALLLAGCISEGVHVGPGSGSDTPATGVLRSQIRSKRLASGLTPEQFMEEIRLLNRDWWYEEARAAQIQKYGPRYRPEGREGLQKPGWPNLWPEEYLYLRAEILSKGGTEQAAVEAAAAQSRDWHSRWLVVTAERPELRMGAVPFDLPPREKPPVAPPPEPRYG